MGLGLLNWNLKSWSKILQVKVHLVFVLLFFFWGGGGGHQSLYEFYNISIYTENIKLLSKLKFGEKKSYHSPFFEQIMLYMPMLFNESDVWYSIFRENVLLLDGRENSFLSASRNGFVAIGPVKYWKIGKQIMFL